MQIVHERLFGSNELAQNILSARESVLVTSEVNHDRPPTFIQGQPIWGDGLAGVQVKGVVSPSKDGDVWTVYDQNQPSGCAWKRNGATYILLANLHGYDGESRDNSRMAQTSRMFDKANRILKSQGGDFKNVVRTWIYLSDILDWYTEFNTVRNAKFEEFSLLTNGLHSHTAEHIYLPASTGIRGENPIGAAGIMDLLAVVNRPGSDVRIKQTSGVKQKSPFRYRSAFSRAMSICDSRIEHILVSGTASIDDRGKSLYPGDLRKQIIQTVDVVKALVSDEDARLEDIYDATVFLKYAADVNTYHEVMREIGLDDIPAVLVVADVCRDELLFELDAAVCSKNGKI